ncbi:hypothetical protein [Streptomyces sp. SLBN-118]|uniref:hypothetical protein n=1 Tax=Streptomyces sp. SLBN-118 TaxID=2768454 RepID=UPI0011524123|nr:hypothetical protein [Streptomyces sp. SLBN-118]
METLRALWPADAPAPLRRRRRRAWFGAAVVVSAVAVAVALSLLLRPAAGPTVTAAEVHVPTQRLHCGQTAELVGVLTTDGRVGP